MSTQIERDNFIEQIGQLPNRITTLVEALCAEELTTAYIPGEWTVAQNVHHLADSHMNSYIRCKLIATEAQPPLKPYDQEAWARFPDAADADISSSLALLAALHSRWVRFWQNLQPEAWQRTGYHPENGIVSLEQQLVLYAAHGEAHIEQIQRTLAARNG